ncbi:MAG: ABC transporter ATP-binding protein [Oscillospiraceae bacterium]|nr:ABC transporter ATP-binding protein [Oscillospiraceae bacterium]
MKAIETSGLTKSYGRARGIVDVDLSVEEGDFFGFIGPNGAGKSTTIRTLLGLIAPSGGSARVLGCDIVTGRREILAQVGYLPSETAFYRGMRVRDVLRLSAKLRHMDCSAEAGRLCERLELDPSRRVEELSLGNRKKVGIVCALQHCPRLYILDEPTSGLDPLMQREFFALLEERCRGGATVFLSSHVLSEVQRHCRHAAVIREGRLLVMDSVEKLGHTDARRVTLRGVHELPPLPELRDARAGQDGVTFLYGGDMPTLLGTLAGMPVTDVTITEPDLEEVFLHYYAKEAE